ncbi:cytochrome c-type biogenesis protein CcmH [Catenovulum maritimum]|uniref:Cytochrome c-type biogenesis protein n=1 Tax=Catenovulum maritimum TaxID=1513271 RepID=A0A0J8H012_9ALTE|nr:cytochrome c-type biogenesis protein [Catenovulum maritimum]KMT66343.1 hypothetical protein XM47_03670 [Catenovulum maritimum]
MKEFFKFVIFITSVFASANLLAVEENYPFESEAKRADFEALVQELRCPKCQNQNVADSNSLVAIDLKNKTYQLVQEGKTKQEVVDYMVQRYTQFVHYDPPVNHVTIWLWIIPGFICIFLVLFVLKRNRTESGSQITDPHIREAEAIFAELEKQSQLKANSNTTQEVDK